MRSDLGKVAGVVGHEGAPVEHAQGREALATGQIHILDAIHEASARDEALVHIQQARQFANFLEGGTHHDTLCSEHVMDNREAAVMVRAELDLVLHLLGSAPDEAYQAADSDHA